jgi:hypothetical protein
VRSRSLSPGGLNLAVGLAALAVAAVVTLGAEAMGGAVTRVVFAPGVLLADLLAWVWPDVRRGQSQSLDLPRICNIVVLWIVFFAVFRRRAFLRRQG